MTTELEDEIIRLYKATRKHLDELEELTGDGGGMVIKEGVKEKIFMDFFTGVAVMLRRRGVGK